MEQSMRRLVEAAGTGTATVLSGNEILNITVE